MTFNEYLEELVSEYNLSPNNVDTIFDNIWLYVDIITNHCFIPNNDYTKIASIIDDVSRTYIVSLGKLLDNQRKKYDAKCNSEDDDDLLLRNYRVPQNSRTSVEYLVEKKYPNNPKSYYALSIYLMTHFREEEEI